MDDNPAKSNGTTIRASPTKPWWRRWFGTRSEHAAERFLKRLGYKILARNYVCSFGELDLVAADGDCVVFIEVRSTEKEDLDGPATSVDSAKQSRLTKLALHFLRRHNLLGRPTRFDVLALSWPADRSAPTIDHHRSAFDASAGLKAFF
jgi:putative endonuclease